MEIITETSPHIKKKSSVNKMMLNVLIALAPTVIFSLVVFGLKALLVYGISLVTILLSEFVFIGLKNMMPKDDKKHTFKEKIKHAYNKDTIHLSAFLSGGVTAVIFSMLMPAEAPWYAVLCGALVGEVIAKLFFGGLGNNIFNPACVGMIFSKMCFGSQYQYPSTWYTKSWHDEIVSGGTPLSIENPNMSYGMITKLFLGQAPGSLGEIFKITILIGAVWLLITKAADFRIMVSSLVTFVLLITVAGLIQNNIPNDQLLNYVLYQTLSGGFLFCVVFMITDPVTSPINRPSRILYGMIFAIIVVFIRLFGAYPEGTGFSILLTNMVVPMLEYPKWSSNQYTWKKLLWMEGILLVAIGILFPTLILSGRAIW